MKKIERSSVIALALLVLGAVGCGKQEYRKEQFETTVSASGFRYIAPKVDILLVIDNSASVSNAILNVQSQLSSFVSSLQSNSWDYHIARITIENPKPIKSILVNSEFNKDTLSDGSPNPDITGLVPSDRAVTNVASFPLIDGTVPSGGADYTYKNIYTALFNAKADTYTNFLRDGAPLAIIVVTNGTDFDVDPAEDGSVNAAQLQTHANHLLSIKGGASDLLRFFPVASYAYYKSGCLTPGGTGRKGTSYFAMNGYIQGMAQWDGNGKPTLNFCDSTSLSHVLSGIGEQLNVIRQSYVYSYLVLPKKPVVSSIHVYKNGQEIPNDAANGWTYGCKDCNNIKGFDTDANGYGSVYTVMDYVDPSTGKIKPLVPPRNLTTGYVISLHGSARMMGDDVPSIVNENE